MSLRIFQFAVIHTVKSFLVDNQTEVDVFFLEFPCFLYDPTNVGNLISGYSSFEASLKGGSALKNLPAVQEMQETLVHSLGQEDLLQKGLSTPYSILTWRIPWTEEPGGL